MERIILLVPVALLPMLWTVVLHKVLNTIPELTGLEQDQLDYVEAQLGTAALVSSQCQAEDETIDGKDIVLPDHIVDRVNALVHMGTNA